MLLWSSTVAVSFSVLLALAAVYAIGFALSWRIVGIYPLDASAGEVAGAVIWLTSSARFAVEDWEPGYLDGLWNFHNHFYSARAVVGGREIGVIYFRYLPDAFGRPCRGRYKNKEIRWYSPPPVRGIDLGRGRFWVWQARRRRGIGGS